MNAPGIYSGMPMSAYLADPCPAPSLSSGCAHTLLTQSPHHAWANHPRNPARLPCDESIAMDTGSIAHALLLEHDESKVVVIDASDYRTKAAREARDTARTAGKHPILADKMTDIRDMVDAARDFVEHSEIRGVFLEGEAESVAIAEEVGVWLRTRPDWLTHDRKMHVSFKTTPGSAEPSGFIRGRLTALGYDVALSLYDRTIQRACGILPASVLLVQEQKAPFACSLISLAPAMADIADAKVDRAIALWRQCLESNRWPSYSGRIHFAEPPSWMLAQAEDEAYRGLTGGVDELQATEGLQA
jgi:hypothetical protein